MPRSSLHPCSETLSLLIARRLNPTLLIPACTFLSPSGSILVGWLDCWLGPPALPDELGSVFPLRLRPHVPAYLSCPDSFCLSRPAHPKDLLRFLHFPAPPFLPRPCPPPLREAFPDHPGRRFLFLLTSPVLGPPPCTTVVLWPLVEVTSRDAQEEGWCWWCPLRAWEDDSRLFLPLWAGVLQTGAGAGGVPAHTG